MHSSLGVAYHLYKAEDIGRQRPLVPMFQSPLRKAFRAAGEALLLLLKRSRLCGAFNILTVDDLHAAMDRVSGSAILLAGYDVKNMYTELRYHTLTALRDYLTMSLPG